MLDKNFEQEKLTEYNSFITTEKGKEWISNWTEKIGSDLGGDFADYLYDFYPEYLCQEMEL